MKINQWANVVRWEMRTRLFLRTTEFLWQEGHTVHASAAEAKKMTLDELEVYRRLTEEFLALPVVPGEKSPGERFPGAENTYTIEVMTQDRKALQSATAHYLGQNFAKAFNVRFNTKEGALEYGYMTSWGSTTRLIGALVMAHGDDDGLRLPPTVSPYQVVIIPVIPKVEKEAEIMAWAEKICSELSQVQFDGEKVRVHIDKREMNGGEKRWDWIKKGVPLRVEVGPRDLESASCMVSRRDDTSGEKKSVTLEALKAEVAITLQEIQKRYFEESSAYRKANTRDDLKSFDELKAFFTPKNEEKPEIHGGFVVAKWCGEASTEELLKELKLSIRCLPLKQSGTSGHCIITGKPATLDVVIAKSY